MPAADNRGARTTRTVRDERFDLIRGFAMLLVVVNHVNIPSLYQVVTMEAIGVVTGAEIFVLVSGTILGLIYRPRIERDGWAVSMIPVWRRALKLYLVVVVTNLAVCLFQWLAPIVDFTVLTTYTDPGSHEVWSLFGEDPTLVELVYRVLTLNYGISQINVLGLYVMLVAVAPFLLWLLQRGRTRRRCLPRAG
ncbi:MAG: OpgC domain-containing protein [Gammaproteobacteria bacterium]